MRNHLKLDQLLNDADREAFLALARHPATTGESAHKWLMERGIVIGRNAVSAFLRREKSPEEREKSQNFYLKVDKVLRPKHRAAYEKLARSPKTTLADLVKFFEDRGYEHVGITAVRTHRQRLRDKLREVRKAAAFARDMAQVVVEFGPEAFRGAAIAGLDQEVMQRVLELREMDQMSAEEFGRWAQSLSEFTGLRHQLDASQQPPKPGVPGAAGVARPKPRSSDGVELSNLVRRMFGVPLPGEPVPALPPPPATPRVPVQSPTTEHTEGTEHTEEKQKSV